MFAGVNAKGAVGKNVKIGTLVKRGRGRYHAIFDDGSELLPLSAFLTDDEETVTRLISSSLRHGVDLAFLVHQLEKASGDMQNFSRSIARALKRRIKDGTEVHGEECPTCNSKLFREEGCINCKNCGFSKCG